MVTCMQLNHVLLLPKVFLDNFNVHEVNLAITGIIFQVRNYFPGIRPSPNHWRIGGWGAAPGGSPGGHIPGAGCRTPGAGGLMTEILYPKFLV